jgi:branched-chain amino acid transport system ATP-binding protein
MTAPLLSVTGLTAAYGQVTALHDVSLEVGPGELVALLGANGAGKSTLMKTVMGFLAPRSGALRFAGEVLDRTPVERRARLGLGYCPEGRRVFPGLTVRENLEVAAHADGATRRQRMESVFVLFEALAAKADTLAWQLSGGQQQMLAIGRALMGAPRLLLLDEPSLGLSPRLAGEMLDKLGVIAASGVAVLLAEQNVAKALTLCHRAYLLELGRVRAHGTAAEIGGSDALRKAFLGG